MVTRKRATCPLCIIASEQDGMKHCHGDCDSVKPLDEFYNDKAQPDGKTTVCQACRKAYQNARYVEDPEFRARDNAASRAWWANKENSKAGKQRRKAKYPDRVANGRIFWKSGGLTLEGYLGWLANQGDVCAICGAQDPGTRGGEWFAIDHDHTCCDSQNSCGKCFRGIVCHRCNTYVIPVYEGTRNGDINELWLFTRAYMAHRVFADHLATPVFLFAQRIPLCFKILLVEFFLSVPIMRRKVDFGHTEVTTGTSDVDVSIAVTERNLDTTNIKQTVLASRFSNELGWQDVNGFMHWRSSVYP